MLSRKQKEVKQMETELIDKLDIHFPGSVVYNDDPTSSSSSREDLLTVDRVLWSYHPLPTIATMEL